MDLYDISISGQTLQKYSQSSTLCHEMSHETVTRMNVIVNPFNIHLLQNISGSCSRLGVHPLLVQHSSLEDFSEFPLSFDSGFFVLTNSSTTIYSLYKSKPSSDQLKIDTIQLKELSSYLR